MQGHRADQAGRSGRAGGVEDLHRLSDQRQLLPPSAGRAWRAGRRGAGIRDHGGLGGIVSRRPVLGRPAGAGGEIRAADRGTGGSAGDPAVHQPGARRHDPGEGSVRGIARRLVKGMIAPSGTSRAR